MVTSRKCRWQSGEWEKLGYLSLFRSALGCVTGTWCPLVSVKLLDCAFLCPTDLGLGVASSVLTSLWVVSLSPICLFCPSITCLTNSLHSTPSTVFLVTLWPAQVSWYVTDMSPMRELCLLLQLRPSSVFPTLCIPDNGPLSVAGSPYSPSNSPNAQSYLLSHVKCSSSPGEYRFVLQVLVQRSHSWLLEWGQAPQVCLQKIVPMCSPLTTVTTSYFSVTLFINVHLPYVPVNSNRAGPVLPLFTVLFPMPSKRHYS